MFSRTALAADGGLSCTPSPASGPRAEYQFSLLTHPAGLHTMGKGSNVQKAKTARDRKLKESSGGSAGGGAAGLAARTGAARHESGCAAAAAKRAERDKLRAEKAKKEADAAARAAKKNKGKGMDDLPPELMAAMAKTKVSKKKK